MAARQAEFDSLMRRVEGGSDEAIRELLETYGGHILRTIRRRLNRQLRSQFDSEDFYQAVWASFFTHEPKPKFESEGELVMFLNRVAGNKVVDECRKQLGTKKRQASHQRSLYDSQTQDTLPVPANSPTPSQVVAAKEQADAMLEGRPSLYRQILDLRRGGGTYVEIANETGVNERTVRRVIKRLGAWLRSNG